MLLRQSCRTTRFIAYGLQTLHGRWPALIASSRLLNVSRFAGEIFFAHSQSGLWNGSRLADATYAGCFWAAAGAAPPGTARVPASIKATISCVRRFMYE